MAHLDVTRAQHPHIDLHESLPETGSISLISREPGHWAQPVQVNLAGSPRQKAPPSHVSEKSLTPHGPEARGGGKTLALHALTYQPTEKKITAERIPLKAALSAEPIKAPDASGFAQSIHEGSNFKRSRIALQTNDEPELQAPRYAFVELDAQGWETLQCVESVVCAFIQPEYFVSLDLSQEKRNLLLHRELVENIDGFWFPPGSNPFGVTSDSEETGQSTTEDENNDPEPKAHEMLTLQAPSGKRQNESQSLLTILVVGKKESDFNNASNSPTVVTLRNDSPDALTGRLILKDYEDTGQPHDDITSDHRFTLDVDGIPEDAILEGFEYRLMPNGEPPSDWLPTGVEQQNLVNGIYEFRATIRRKSGTIETLSARAITIDTQAPEINSGHAATPLSESARKGTPVYTLAALDGQGKEGAEPALLYNLRSEQDDAQFFSIHPLTGVVTFNDSPDYETKSHYRFKVVATDWAGNASEQSVDLEILNEDEVAPTFNSGSQAVIDENSGDDAVVYTARATDNDALTGSILLYSLKSDADGADFNIASHTGVVSLKASPNYEVKSVYQFTVVVTDVGEIRRNRA